MIQNDIDYDAQKGNFKKQLLDKSDETLTGLAFKSKGNKVVRLSDGTTFGSNFLKNPVDPLDMFKGVSELEFKNFRKQYLTNEGNLQRSILSKEANKKRLKINLANTDNIPKELLNKNITRKQLDDLTKLKIFEMNRIASMEAASKNVKKKYSSILTNRLNSGIPIDSILSTIANDLNIPVEQVKNVANSLLANTDWMVIRKAERDVAIPSATATYRAAVLTECARLETAITNAADVDAVAAVMNAQNWPGES